MQNGARKIKTHNCLEQQVGSYPLNKVTALARDFHVPTNQSPLCLSAQVKNQQCKLPFSVALSDLPGLFFLLLLNPATPNTLISYTYTYTCHI